MFTSKRTCLSAAVSGILAAAVAMPAMAQGTEMEEIIVTARKRDESCLRRAGDVNVFTAPGNRVGRHPSARRTSSSWCRT